MKSLYQEIEDQFELDYDQYPTADEIEAAHEAQAQEAMDEYDAECERQYNEYYDNVLNADIDLNNVSSITEAKAAILAFFGGCEGYATDYFRFNEGSGMQHTVIATDFPYWMDEEDDNVVNTEECPEYTDEDSDLNDDLPF